MTADFNLKKMVARSGLSAVGVFMREIEADVTLEINADLSFHAASTMKIPVMMEVFHQASQGFVSLSEPIIVTNSFTSAFQGMPFALSPEDDSDPELYEKVGSPVATFDLVERMITRSSNLATNILMQKFGVTAIQQFMEDLRCPEIRVVRGVEDKAAFRAGISNTTTARALGTLLTQIFCGSSFNSLERKQMVEILQRQQYREGIPAGIPNCLWVGNKTGWIEKIYHDAALVQMNPNRRFVLIVLTDGGGTTKGAQFAAEVAAMCAASE